MKRIIILILFLLLSLLSCSPIDTAIQQGQPVYIYPLYSWNGTAWQQVGFGSSNFTTETDPIYTLASGNIVTLAGTQELDNKTVDAAVLKGTFTASGVVSWPAFTQTGNIKTNNNYFDAEANGFYFTNTGNEKGIQFYNVNNSDRGGRFYFLHNSSSPATNDWVGYFEQNGKKTNGTEYNAALTITKVIDITAGSEDTAIYYYLVSGGSQNLAMYLEGDGTLYLDVGTSIFDDKDDAMVLKKAISLGDKTELLSMKILTPKIDKNGNIVKDEYMMSQKDIIRLLAGAAYQNRDKIDALEKRISELEARLK